MVKAVGAARKAARKAIENTYEGVATVSEYQKVEDEKTGLTNHKPVVVLENQSCKLSFETISSANQTESVATITQTTKLFVSPDVNIKPGSKLTVTQNGITTDYMSSGVPAVYPTHQEIILELFERWA